MNRINLDYICDVKQLTFIMANDTTTMLGRSVFLNDLFNYIEDKLDDDLRRANGYIDKYEHDPDVNIFDLQAEVKAIRSNLAELKELIQHDFKG